MRIPVQNLLFVMPKDGELFIAAWAAVSSYISKLQKGGVRTTTVLIAEENDLTDLIAPPLVTIYPDMNSIPVMSFDLAVDFTDVKDIRAISEPTRKSAASGYAMLLGFEFIGELVRLPSLACEVEKDILILEWGPGATKFKELVDKRFPELQVDVLALDPMKLESFKTVAKYKLILGERSVLTYIATALNRFVFELYSFEDYGETFLAKWSAGKYYMMAVENKQAIDNNLSYIWRQFERIKNRVFGRQEFQSQSAQTP